MKAFSLTRLIHSQCQKLELQESVLQAYQQQINPNYVPPQVSSEHDYPQEVQHQRDYYP